MTFPKISIYWLVTLSPLIVSCTLLNKTEQMIFPKEIDKSITEAKTIYITCNRSDIKDYLDKGWMIVNSKNKEVTCSWKTKLASPGCNVKRDKGCLVRVPDKKGEEIQYFLERTKHSSEKVD